MKGGGLEEGRGLEEGMIAAAVEKFVGVLD